METTLNAYGLDVNEDLSQASGYQEDAKEAAWSAIILLIIGLALAMFTPAPWIFPAFILIAAGFSLVIACHLGRRAAWEFEYNFLWNDVPD